MKLIKQALKIIRKFKDGRGFTRQEVLDLFDGDMIKTNKTIGFMYSSCGIINEEENFFSKRLLVGDRGHDLDCKYFLTSEAIFFLDEHDNRYKQKRDRIITIFVSSIILLISFVSCLKLYGVF